MMIVEFKGWELKVVTTKLGTQAECRKTFKGPMKYDNYSHIDTLFGQVLMIVTRDSWHYNKQSGKNNIRFSMNGPIPLSFQEIEEFAQVANRAKYLLKCIEDEKTENKKPPIIDNFDEKLTKLKNEAGKIGCKIKTRNRNGKLYVTIEWDNTTFDELSYSYKKTGDLIKSVFPSAHCTSFSAMSGGTYRVNPKE